MRCFVAHARHVCPSSMIESVSNLKKKAKKGPTPENTAFQQLFLLVGMHLFKVYALKCTSRSPVIGFIYTHKNTVCWHKNKTLEMSWIIDSEHCHECVSPEGPWRAAGHHEGSAELCGQSSGEEGQEEKEETRWGFIHSVVLPHLNIALHRIYFHKVILQKRQTCHLHLQRCNIFCQYSIE